MMLYSKIQARLVLTPRLAWWWHVSKAVIPKLEQECLLNSSPQRFWCFKPVSWKTVSPPDKDEGHGLGMIQGHYTYCLLCFSSNLPLIWQDVQRPGTPAVINEDWWVLWASRFLRFFFFWELTRLIMLILTWGLCILFWYLEVENGKSVIMGTVVSKSGAVQIYISKWWFCFNGLLKFPF